MCIKKVRFFVFTTSIIWKYFLIKRCVELDPKNLLAYITLASCYANEMLTNEALDSLRKWLANNDKYSHLLSNRRSQTTTNEPRLIDEYVFQLIFDIFDFSCIFLDWPLKNYKSPFYKQSHYQLIQMILILIFRYDYSFVLN